MSEEKSFGFRIAVVIGSVVGAFLAVLFVLLFSRQASAPAALAEEDIVLPPAQVAAPAKIPTRVEYREDLAFFDPVKGEPVIWYYKLPDGSYELFDGPFDGPRFHPTYGKEAPLQAVTQTIVADIQASFSKPLRRLEPVRTAGRVAPRRATQPQVQSQPRAVTEASAPTEPNISVPASAPMSVSIPAGTEIQVVLARQISTENDRAGGSFPATVSRAISVDGEVVVPVGTEATGTITFAERPGRVRGVAALTLVLTDVVLGGNSVPIKTEPLPLGGETSKAEDAVKVGTGAGGGAGLGAILGGKKGAGIGAIIGSAAGAGTVLATRGEDLVLPPEHKLTFTLNRDLTVQR